MNPEASEFTQLLESAREGSASAKELLFRLVYDELRAVARRRLANAGPHSIETTELVNDAYLRLNHKQQLDVQNRRHFFSVAARAMHDLLVERARSRAALRRGGDLEPVSLHSAITDARKNPEEMLMLEQALQRLYDQDPRSAEVVELKYFGGFSGDEVAEVLGVSPSTVDRLWSFARAWLRKELSDESV